MKLNHIKEGTIIIAPSYLHHSIRKMLLENRSGRMNVHIHSLSTFLGDGEKDSSTYEYYLALKSLHASLIYQKNSVSSLAFINELKTLITHMKEYQIPCNRLPQTTPIEQELKMIIEKLYPIHLPIDQTLDAMLEKLNESKRIVIYEGYSSYYENSIYKLFEISGATRIDMRTKLQNKELYFALNKRVEVESAAQYIIAHNLQAKDIKISLLDNTYLPYVKMIFHHYGIPIQVQDEREYTFIQNKFITMLKYYLQPNHETAVALLSAQIFKIPYAKETIDYLTLYELDLHDTFDIVTKAQISNDIISERELKRLQDLEEKANQVREHILPILIAMEKLIDIIDVLCYIDTQIIKTHHFTTKEERQAVLQIRDEIKKSDQYLNEKADLVFFIEVLMQLKVKKEGTVEGCAISDFMHPLPQRVYHIVLGCTQNNFPATPTFSGIFTESYYEAIKYPSLEDRYALHMKYYLHNLSTSEQLICFYPISTIDGKANEASLELEQFMFPVQAMKYAIKANYIPYQRSYHISQKTARALFIKGDTLYGSISSLERYANCPYAYFLRYGLNIREAVDYSFNNAKAGTLNHYLMEVLSNTYGKQYVNAKKAEVFSLLNKKVAEIAKLYPNQKAALQQMEKRLLNSIMKNLEVLKDHEEHSHLDTMLSEYRFSYEFALANNTLNLQLNGIIDRIDMNQDFFRIIDYKSSPKSLKEEQVFAALQLQLITYLCVMEKELKLRPLGAFYYSFANPNINMEYAKRTKRPLALKIYHESDAQQDLYKEKKMSGWITNEYIEVMDDSGAHVKGVRNSKASGINATTIYRSETLYEYIQNIYSLLADAIISGNIECKSATNACTYCPYAALCVKANHSFAKAKLVELKDELYIKGGRKHD